MRWRLGQLDWNYGLSELVIVTAGVLIALAIDQWNDGRIERAEEGEAIAGILADLEEDLINFGFTIDLAGEKKASLERVRASLAGGVPGDTRAFLQDVVNGANFGWSQPFAARATFDDLVASGRLSVIRDRGIRQAIAAYSRSFDGEADRIDERETQYPNLSYALVPRRTGTTREDNVGDVWLAADLSNSELDAILLGVRESQLATYLTAEINLAVFIGAIKVNQRQRATALVERIRNYQQAAVLD